MYKIRLATKKDLLTLSKLLQEIDVAQKIETTTVLKGNQLWIWLKKKEGLKT